jgi:tRNA pseudouridine55 synthase
MAAQALMAVQPLRAARARMAPLAASGRGAFHGVIIVDKPVGPTSFDVVRQVRRLTGVRRVGHGGTLDPLASGVLPVCLGEGTKLAQFFLDADKEYLATIQFGAETTTDDAAGAVTATYPVAELSPARVALALDGFRGEQTQVPPMFSALKRDGRPLYDYARAGEVVERAARRIAILELELLAFHACGGDADQEGGRGSPGPTADVRVRCSKGTYIRTLARDLGTALGSGAHLAALRRTRSGPFELARSVSLDRLMAGELALIPLAEALGDLATLRLTEGAVRMVSQGQAVTWDELAGPSSATVGQGDCGSPCEDGRLTRLLGPTGDLVAVARRGAPSERVRTLRVFGADRHDVREPRAPVGPSCAPPMETGVERGDGWMPTQDAERDAEQDTENV